jgi:two-component system response regulator FixJ
MRELPTFPKRSVLTPRQLEVAACLIHGMSNKETARELHLSPRTVEDHRQAINTRLGTRNTVALIRMVYQLGGSHEA